MTSDSLAHVPADRLAAWLDEAVRARAVRLPDVDPVRHAADDEWIDRWITELRAELAQRSGARKRGKRVG